LFNQICLHVSFLTLLSHFNIISDREIRWFFTREACVGWFSSWMFLSRASRQFWWNNKILFIWKCQKRRKN